MQESLEGDESRISQPVGIAFMKRPPNINVNTLVRGTIEAVPGGSAGN